MPSFMIHTIAGEKMIKKLNLQEEDKKKFFISNLLPDTVDRKYYKEYKGAERRARKQQIKRITHFRTDYSHTFEYPNLEYFLSKYEEQVKVDINFLAYFFHLYTDYYYFAKYLPTIITFYDKDHKESKSRSENVTVEIKNYHTEIDHEDFWDNFGDKSIYSDYSRLNQYLISKYKLSFETDELINYLNSTNYNVDMEEINPSLAIQALNNLKRIVTESLKQPEEKLKIFTIDQIENLMDETVSTFLETYGYLLEGYKEKGAKSCTI